MVCRDGCRGGGPSGVVSLGGKVGEDCGGRPCKGRWAGEGIRNCGDHGGGIKWGEGEDAREELVLPDLDPSLTLTGLA